MPPSGFFLNYVLPPLGGAVCRPKRHRVVRKGFPVCNETLLSDHRSVGANQFSKQSCALTGISGANFFRLSEKP